MESSTQFHQENDPSIEELSQNKAESSDLENSSPVEIQIPENSSRRISETEVTETKVTSSKRSESKFTIKEEQVISLEENKKARKSIQKFSWVSRRLPVVLTFEAQERPKQRVFGNQSQTNRQNIPPPPSYYPQGPPVRNQPARAQSNQDIQFNRLRAPQINDLNFRQIFINPSYWIPYPTSIPPNTPPCLGHLVGIDALFVIKNFEILELLTGLSEPDLFLIQNKNGDCLYYVYEISDYMTGYCQGRRGVRLIVKDLYQNEVIFMNKFCGCNIPCFCCCYPVMEVYAPPSVPVGAVIRVCESSRDDYLILDADENKMFKICGSCSGNFCPSCTELVYSIHALDRDKTIVGYIKRQYGDFRTFTLNAEVCGISFLPNLDVRIKSVFLGALMLIQISYFS